MTDDRSTSTAGDGQVVHVPAGWYADPEGVGMRYWDGAQWTEHRSAPPPNSTPGTTAASSKKGDFLSDHPVLLIWVGVLMLGYLPFLLIDLASGDCTRSGVVVECQSENLTTTYNLFLMGVLVVFGLLAILRGVLLRRARKSGTK